MAYANSISLHFHVIDKLLSTCSKFWDCAFSRYLEELFAASSALCTELAFFIFKPFTQIFDRQRRRPIVALISCGSLQEPFLHNFGRGVQVKNALIKLPCGLWHNRLNSIFGLRMRFFYSP